MEIFGTRGQYRLHFVSDMANSLKQSKTTNILHVPTPHSTSLSGGDRHNAWGVQAEETKQKATTVSKDISEQRAQKARTCPKTRAYLLLNSSFKTRQKISIISVKALNFCFNKLLPRHEALCYGFSITR